MKLDKLFLQETPAASQKITEQKITDSYAANSKGGVQANQDFLKFFEKAEQKDKPAKKEPAALSQAKDRVSGKTKNNGEVSGKQDKPEKLEKPENKPIDTTDKTEKKEEPAQNKQKPVQEGNTSAGTKETREEKPDSILNGTLKTQAYLFNTSDESLINALALIFNIPVEALKEILDKLNISPLDLTNNNNLLALAQAVYGADSPEDLLSVENIGQILKNAADTAAAYENIKAPGEQAAQTQFQQTESIQTVNVNTADQAAQTAEADPTAQAVEVTATEVIAAGVTDETIQNTGRTEADRYIPQDPGGNQLQTDYQQPVQQIAQSSGNGGGSQQAMDNGPNPGINQQVLPENILNPGMQQALLEGRAVFAQTLASASSSPTGTGIGTQEIIDQLVQFMKVEVRGNISEVRLTLKPEFLGDVSLKIARDNGIITAHFMAENQRVKEIIESNFSQLRQSLEDQGITVSQLSVTIGENSQEQLRQFFMSQNGGQDRMNAINRGLFNTSGTGETEEILPAVSDGLGTVDFRA